MAIKLILQTELQNLINKAINIEGFCRTNNVSQYRSFETTKEKLKESIQTHLGSKGKCYYDTNTRIYQVIFDEFQYIEFQIKKA